MSIRALVVEDEALIRWSLRQKFEERGYRVSEADCGKAALEQLDNGVFDLVMLDYKLPDMTGLDVLRHMREADQDAVAIMMTAFSTIESAVEAIKLGAFDYVPKPFQMEQLLLTVDKALETTRLRREVRELRRQLRDEFGSDNIIGQHPSMVSVLHTVQQVGQAGATTVLLRGETGTGKDLIARYIHNSSERARRPFVNITCTALSDTLLESELFGYERGAFTDAKTQKKGLLELADGGTAFLDEIGDMQPALQAKLLRFLEERCFRRVGGTRELSVDVRVVAATNRDIEAAIAEGKFRRDLFYRLNVVGIELPPLRARGDDLRLLATHFIERFAREFKKRIGGLDESGMRKLRAYHWPGNVRELRNVIERAVLLCKRETIGADDLVTGATEAAGASPELCVCAAETNGVHRQEALEADRFTLPPEGYDLDQLHRIELHLLKQAMERTHNNQTQAARLLNLSRDQLRYRLQKHGLLA